MTSKGNLSKVLTFRVKQLNGCHQKFQASLGAYVGQITGCAQAWIEKSEDLDQDKFVDMTVQLDEAMMMLEEMTSDIENNLAGLPSGAGPAGMAVQSAADSPTQTNVASPSLDASIRSLLERLDTLQNVTDTVQELRADLDACKAQMDSVEGMRESLENITSHCGMLIHASSAQAKTRCEQFHTSQLTQIQHFEKQLSQMQTSLSKTDSEMKEVANFVNVFSEQFADRIRALTEPEDQLPPVENSAQIENSLSNLVGRLCQLETVTETTDDGVRGIEEELAELDTKNGPLDEQMGGESGSSDVDVLQMDSVESTMSSQPPTVTVTEPAVTRWTGFCVRCTDDIKTAPWSSSIRWQVLGRGTSCGFDVRDGVFTAPVHGLYLVLFVHYQTGLKPSTIRLILSDKGHRHQRAMITTDTTSHNEYDVGRRYIAMNAGDTLYLSLPTKHCRLQIPFFSCVLVM